MEKILCRNESPRYLVKSKIREYNKEILKPERLKIDTTLCLQYTCPQTEIFAKQSVQKIKTVLLKYKLYYTI